jgi:hypothetical protein
MMASPVITFLWLNREAVPAVQSGEHGALTWAETSTQNATALSGSVAPAAVSQTGQPAAMLWLVEAWFLGVLLLSLRTAGGLLVIARMRRKEIKPVTGELAIASAIGWMRPRCWDGFGRPYFCRCAL